MNPNSINQTTVKVAGGMSHRIGAAIGVAVCMSLGSTSQAGILNLIAFNETPTSFTSTFEWADAGGTWNANLTVLGQFWEVDMFGAGVGRPGGGSLSEDSRHLVNPPGHIDIAPNRWSTWNYPGVSAGTVAPVNSWLYHRGDNPRHTNVYSLSTIVLAPGLVQIDFSGQHEGIPSGFYRIPTPGTSAAFAVLTLAAVRRRRRR